MTSRSNPIGRSGCAAPASARRAPDARTLYLGGGTRLRVTSTGEALVVSVVNGPIHRFPIARIARVACSPLTDWSGAALALCLSRRISVTWVDARGRATGHLWPAKLAPMPLAELLETLAAESAAWPEAYANWLRQQRMQTLRGWRTARANAGHPVPECEWQQAKQAYVYRAEVPQHLPAALHGMAAAFVASRLTEWELAHHYWPTGGAPLELADDLTQLLWAEMNLRAGPLADALDTPAEAATIFERWSGRCVELLHALIARLHAHARRVAEI